MGRGGYNAPDATATRAGRRSDDQGRGGYNAPAARLAPTDDDAGRGGYN